MQSKINLLPIITLVSLVGSIFLLFPSSSAQAATNNENIFGINVSMEIRFQQSEEAAVMAKLNDLNIKWVREEFNWNTLEPSQGVFDWSGYDRSMALYKNSGINVLGVLAYSSEWASTAPASVSFRDKYPPSPEAWKNFITAVVSRYPEILYWEVWNEPNHANFLIADDKIASYKSILETASVAIRSANPQAKVVIGGFSGADSDFLRRLYLAGAKDLFDIVAVHPYRTNFGQTIYSPEITQYGLNSLATDLYVMRSMIRAFDQQSPAPIWITELGWPTWSGGVSEIAQANYLQRSFIISRLYPEVEKIFWYNLRDDTAADHEDKTFGLFAYDWREKPTARAFRQLATAYPTLTIKEDMEAFSKPIDEFRDASRFYIEAFDNGKFIRKETVTSRTDLRASRGLGSIAYRYAFANNRVGQYRRLVIKNAAPSNAESYDLWLWSDGGIHPVRLRFKDATGEIFQGNAGYTGYGWEHLTVSLKDTVNSFVSWGGDNDKKVDFPVSLDSLIMEKNPDSPSLKGEVILSRFTYRRFDQAYSYRFQQDGRNTWAMWKMNSPAQVVTTYTPITTRLLNIWNYNDGGFRNLTPIDSLKRKVIMFGLEERPLFIQ